LNIDVLRIVSLLVLAIVFFVSARVIADLSFKVYTNLPRLSVDNIQKVNNAFVNGEVLSATAIKLTTPNQTVRLQDPRAYVFDEYFRRNNSPLRNTGDIFVANCLKYTMPRDCITIVAIARAETDLCKYGGSDSYFNCWGFGGGGIHRMRFTSWEQSIDRVSRSLGWSYGSRYILNPRLMATTFCGSEPGCTGWGERVLFFMAEIDRLGIELGVGSLFTLR